MENSLNLTVVVNVDVISTEFIDHHKLALQLSNTYNLKFEVSEVFYSPRLGRKSLETQVKFKAVDSVKYIKP